MAQVMAELTVLPKGEEFRGRGMESYKFRGVDSTINAVGPLFRRYGIVGPVPHVDDVRYETVPVGQDNRPTGFARVIVTYRFIGVDGDELTCTVPGEAMDRGDKALAKAMSVALRIALLQTLCLPTEDADPDSENYERGDDARTAADAARDALLAKIKQLGLNSRDVARLYRADTQRDITEETDAGRIADFTARLQPEAKA